MGTRKKWFFHLTCICTQS